MHESKISDTAQPSGEGQQTSPNPEMFEVPFVEDRKPDYSHPTIPRLAEAEIQKILSGVAIERGKGSLHVVHYVGGIELDTQPDMDQTFTNYAMTHGLDVPLEVVSLYTGPLTAEDNAIVRKLLGYNGMKMADEERVAETARLSPEASRLMLDTIMPQQLSYTAALELIQKDNLRPLAYYHKVEPYRDLSEKDKIFFWIDDTFGGEITLRVGPTFDDSLAGPMADGEIVVNLRGILAGLLYWNTWHSSGVRWSVDPFLRSIILAESPDNQMYTKL